MLQTHRYKNEQTLSYAEYGDPKGFPILIQHGLIASIQDELLFERLLASCTRLICIARPGYGQSSPYRMKNIAEWGEIVSGLVEQLKLPRFDLFGISSGAPYTYAIAASCRGLARNLFILSGTPALFDARVRAHWPYPVDPSASIADLQKLAFELFFAQQTSAALDTPDLKDSLAHNCFGIAQDFKLRCVDWGFHWTYIQQNVVMRHSRVDDSVPLICAEITAKMLPHCRLDIQENDSHFSKAVLDRFIQQVIAVSS
jgi:pimeloyl-ACP methyl ester carboxylesterase